MKTRAALKGGKTLGQLESTGRKNPGGAGDYPGDLLLLLPYVSLTGEVFTMILPVCNSEAMELYLQDLGRHFRRYPVIPGLDRAAWHVREQLHWPKT